MADNGWILGQMDIRSAHLQALGFDREIYVKPQKEAADPSGLWQLKAAAYDLVDRGRLWYQMSDLFLVIEHLLTISRY